MRRPKENEDRHENHEEEANQGPARCDDHAVILA